MRLGRAATEATSEPCFRKAEIELFSSLKGRLPKKICFGAVSHGTRQCDRPQNVAARIRRALEHIAPEQLVVSTDCGSAARA